MTQSEALRWSIDDSTLILSDTNAGGILLDSRSGELQARVDGAKQPAQSVVSPDLRHMITRFHDKLRFGLLPPPDQRSPSTRLAGILADTGLALRGADLVDADVRPR